MSNLGGGVPLQPGEISEPPYARPSSAPAPEQSRGTVWKGPLPADFGTVAITTSQLAASGGDRVADFLRELSALTLKHGIQIAACGCCDSPYLLALAESERGMDHDLGRNVEWDHRRRVYTVEE